jgi:DNA-binding NtrC family response regulator
VRSKILLVDDEEVVRSAIHTFLAAHDFQVCEAPHCEAAERAFSAEQPDVVILDYSLPDGTALDLMPRLKSIDARVPIVILTGFGSIDLAVRMIKEGADHFLTKPVELHTLVVILKRLVETRRERHRQLARRAARGRDQVDPFHGSSTAILRLADQARRVLASESPILIQGETGTGKGVLARWLHDNGPRADEAFVDVNCAGLTREFLETELFGHERGAYTGAVSPKQGLLEVADEGSVCLDEVGDVDLQVQPKLLKVLEEKRFRRLGGIVDRQVDIRLIAATHHDLERLVEERRFREDLYYRISAIVLQVPPLRERKEDVVPLARGLLARLPATMRPEEVDFSADAEQALERYPWPGNIRELRNVLERAVLLAGRRVLRAEDLGLNEHHPAADGPVDTSLTLEQMEQRHIEAVLSEEQGRIGRAAHRLGIHRSSLYKKVRKYGLPALRN